MSRRSFSARALAGPPSVSFATISRASWLVAIPLLCLLPCAHASTDARGTDPALIVDDMVSMMPPRERAFVDLLLDARRQYEAASSDAERAQCRLAMEIAMKRFMDDSQDMQDWVGIFRASHTNEEGDRRLLIEIGPGISIATGKNRRDDPNLLTLIEPHSATYSVIDSIAVGEPVVFSGRIVAGRLASDDVMVEQPLLYAHFSSLRPAR